VAKKARAAPQLDLFAAPAAADPKERDVLETLRNTDVERMTPLDALSLVARLQTRLK
jgi:hypothetical protein